MSNSEELSLPTYVPWKLVAVSPDMMDTNYCNKSFPFLWRSSLAISVFEPDEDELPEAYSDRCISYIKVACTITGYQPTKEETEKGLSSFPKVPTEDLKRILSEYFACYGVLVNVAVFPEEHPNSELVSPSTYPCIIDFEPKERDLIQAASEEGELLTASQSKVKTDKTFAHTSTTKGGLELNAKYKITNNLELGGKIAPSWEDSDKDSRTVSAESSRERKETQGTSATINQMYNLLTGYHIGTNRAVFLMLPRPHTLQPTNRRTFAQGLRVIEGIQEFFLVVSRPKEMTRYCIEAQLETSHFPEVVQVEIPKTEYETNSEKFWVNKTSTWGVMGSDVVHIDTTHTIPNGWEIDRSKGDAGHPGISMIQDDSNGRAKNTLHGYNYGAISDSAVEVVGTIEAYSWFFSGTDAHFKRLYEVFMRREKIKNEEDLPKVKTPFLITSRSLCVCLGQRNVRMKPLDKAINESIVDVREIHVPMKMLKPDTTSWIPVPDFEQLLTEIKFAMNTSWRLPTRQAYGEVGFLDSDYFKNQILKLLPENDLKTPVAELGIFSSEVTELLGQRCTLGDALAMDLSTFAKKTKLKIPEAISERNKLLANNK